MEKFKVGDKIKIISATNGSWGANGKGGVVTLDKSTDGLLATNVGFNVRTSTNKVWRIGFASSCELLEPSKKECIVIYRKGSEVIALDKSNGESGIAKCCPTDTFDFRIGTKLAFERLLGKDKIKVREVKRKAKVGE